MATITPIKHTPHTRIENTIIANMSEMGVYCYAVYCAIKMHLNQATGDCFPSYATIARITGIHRSTVIPTVSLDVICLVASSCGYYRGHIVHRVAHSFAVHVATQRGLAERP